MREIVLLEARKEAYTPSDCVGKTLTVGELRRELEKFFDDEPVVVSNDGGYTYGAVTEYSFTEV